MKLNIILRADAGTQMGTGHVMRCLALAQAWQDAGGTAHFAAVDTPDGLATRLATEGMTLHRLDTAPGSPDDAAQTAALAHELNVGWVVQDGYHFGTEYQHAIKNAGLCLLAIDDYGHADHYVADLVLNQNIHADESLYPHRSPSTSLLLGTQYVLLRREFSHWRGWQRNIPEIARKVLVTLGGGDPDNVTLKVVEALREFDNSDLEVQILAGAANPNLERLKKEISDNPNYTLLTNAADVPGLMAWADIAVAAGGSTCWELAFMGLPAALLVLADNQRDIVEGLRSMGAATSLGWHHAVTPTNIASKLKNLSSNRQLRKRMVDRAEQLVDGVGTARVVARLTRLQNITD